MLRGAGTSGRVSAGGGGGAVATCVSSQPPGPWYGQGFATTVGETASGLSGFLSAASFVLTGAASAGISKMGWPSGDMGMSRGCWPCGRELEASSSATKSGGG